MQKGKDAPSLSLSSLPPSLPLKLKRKTLGQQGRIEDDGHTHLADWTFSVAVIERRRRRKKKKKKKKKK